MVRDILQKHITSALTALSFPHEHVELGHPSSEAHGDYSTNVAMILKGNPREAATKIVDELEKDQELKKIISKIEIAGPGFINFWLSENYLLDSMIRFIDTKIEFSPYHFGTHKKVMVEFAHPNTHKPFHIGHLRNIVTGESLVRILEASGNSVVRANYEGDVGMHIAKCLWVLNKNSGNLPTNLNKQVALLGDSYVKGNNAYEDDLQAREEIIEINKQIYQKEGDLYELWKTTRKWSLGYFEKIYQRVGTRFDRLFFESEVYERGLATAKRALDKRILKESEGAVVFDGEQYGLHTRVFVTKDGNPTYEGKDLGLAELETSEFGDLDKIIHVVDIQQSSYFQVLFKVLELIDAHRYKGIEYHFPYGFVKLTEGRMSSRKGTVVLGEWLLDEVKKRIRATYDISDETAEAVAVGAVKYSFLKVDAKAEIMFDIEQSISLSGDSGPYIQYTYARTCSVLSKDTYASNTIGDDLKLTPEELSVLRLLYQFPEIVHKAGINMAPHIIAGFLYDVSQKYNLFYQKVRILQSENPEKNFRLALTAATAQVIKNGLTLLGIPVVEKM